MKNIEPPFKIFKSHLADAFFITPEKLYREFKVHLEKIDKFQNGRIYFIVKKPKSRFKKVKINKDCSISFKYESQGFFSKSHRILISEILLRLKILDEGLLLSTSEIKNNLIYVESTNPALRKSDPELKIIYVTQSTERMDRKNRALTIKLLPSSLSNHHQEGIELPLFAHQLLRDTGDSNVKCEILYIGKANELKKRMKGHGHLQQAQAECSDAEEIHLYFFTPKYESMSLHGCYIDLQPRDLLELADEDKVLICEVGLINYFKPSLNKNHKDSDIVKSGTLKKISDRGCTHFIMNCMFDEDDYFFGTDSVEYKGCHKKIYTL
ncbi:hypothetical protein [Erwinia mallotivora]|uniref:GIY-YIG domain-containing protein n=1 Tax=Erwinia mallotivora TaxID=69222 RepID=A0A014N7G4_9GAMM|nr:hypothetical protein [Erwinia mallotivora]EXU75333.1 hypothetical protein BG55_11855 [Erwinia mallotivora]